MKKMSFFVLFFIFFALSCSEEKTPVDVSGQLNQKCKAGNVCNDDLACKNNVCIAKADACKGIFCSNQGTCTVENSKAVCECNSGYMREDDIKCVLADVCSGVTCSNHGTCSVVNDAPLCECDNGYSVGPTGTICIENLDPCANITCGGEERGVCQVSNTGVLECACKDGYHAQGLNCISDNNPCEGVACSDHGTCYTTEGTAACNCEAGYQPSGLQCIDESNNPCQGITCSGHGSCEVHNNEATCICDAGYTPSADLTCLGGGGSDVCEEVTCADADNVPHGACMADDTGNPVCMCDPGYIRAGFMCIEEFGSPCKDVTCSDHGTCKVDNLDVAYCECETNYYPGENLTCVDQAVVCSGITCSNHGSCSVQADGTPTCNCDEGYVAVGTECIANPCEPNPCLDVENTVLGHTCIAHPNNTFSCECSVGFFWNATNNTCEDNSCPNAHMHPEGGTCVCDEGYQFDENNEYCILIGGVCDSNPCAGTPNTQCVIDETSIEGYVCDCKEGFDYDQFNNCVAAVCADNPCLDNNEEHRNICVPNGNTYACECDTGYVDNAGTCEFEGGNGNGSCEPNPCTGVSHATGVCEEGPVEFPGLYFCSCESTYSWNMETCLSCDTCNFPHTTGECTISFDGETQECECEEGYTLTYEGVEDPVPTCVEDN